MGVTLVLAFVLSYLSLSYLPEFMALALVAVFTALTVLAFWFFRDPPRRVGMGIVSPADGKICLVQRSGKKQKVSIFMNVNNVHVNRAPITGRVERTLHKPGAHVPAFRKDSSRNERFHTLIKSEKGTVHVVQIAGWLARRIVSYTSPGQTIRRGQRMGMIRFGSRVDVILPGNAAIKVVPGQRVWAGETTLAVWRG